MTEIVVLSGKGGTGKTSITSALASLVPNGIFCDCDVDAADLHLILKPEIVEEHDFASGKKAEIIQDQCTRCGECFDVCRFDAIKIKDGQYIVNPMSCEGCRLCERICPTQTIITHSYFHNKWYISDTRFGTLVHGRLSPGEENSGRLVSQIRTKAKEIAQKQQADYILSDGPPGIGCPVIASLTGADKVLLVTEPTISGLHDLNRVVELIRTFKIQLFVVINKADLSDSLCEKIKVECENNGVPVIAELLFDEDYVRAMVKGQSIIEYDSSGASAQAVKGIWNKLK